MTHAIVMYSGGIGSWAAGMRAVERYGREHTTLLFCDTRMEDEDLYRFLHEGAAVIGINVTIIADGRTPWEVFRDEKFLGNSRIDPCSKILKRNLADRWVKAHYRPEECIRLVGMDFCQREHLRLERLQARCAPYLVDAPLFWTMPHPEAERLRWWNMPLDKEAAKLLAIQHGLRIPRLYELGFAHNNCGGACVKAGQQQWALVYRTMPERYAFHQAQETAMRELLGDVSILKDRSGDGKNKPLTLASFAKRLDQQGELPFQDEDDAPCKCFV